MKIILFSLFTFVSCMNLHSQVALRQITIDDVVNTLSLESSAAKVEILRSKNDLLQFDNYKKGFLPAISLSMNPVNFNRALRILQQPNDGSYSYIEDYSNTSNLGVTIRQKVGLTGGSLQVGSNLSYLNEFSRNRHSFSTSPFNIGYSQQFWGGRKLYRLEKNIEYAKNEIAIKQHCISISQVQQEALNLFMSTLLNLLEYKMARQNKETNDTLLYIGEAKLNNGKITDYDYKQIEFQSLNTQYVYENTKKIMNNPSNACLHTLDWRMRIAK